MHLQAALGTSDASAIDVSRPLTVGGLSLGIEAANEAAAILSAGTFSDVVTVIPAPGADEFYWQVMNAGNPAGEVFGLPAMADFKGTLPTAIEIAIVRALAGSEATGHAEILAGAAIIAIEKPGSASFAPVAAKAQRPLAGTSLLWRQRSNVNLTERYARTFPGTARICLENSFRTSPLKFRFLEIYRMMESLFLRDVKEKLLREFDAEPVAALDQALKEVKSELMQFVELSKRETEAFEYCWLSLEQICKTNKLCIALFRKLKKENRLPTPHTEATLGAALLYFVRCAIVHAGDRDLIFENFSDGDDALDQLMPYVEDAALRLCGIQTS